MQNYKNQAGNQSRSLNIFTRKDNKNGFCLSSEAVVEAMAGFEPANNGFANRRLRPLGYIADTTAQEGKPAPYLPAGHAPPKARLR